MALRNVTGIRVSSDVFEALDAHAGADAAGTTRGVPGPGVALVGLVAGVVAAVAVRRGRKGF